MWWGTRHLCDPPVFYYTRTSPMLMVCSVYTVLILGVHNRSFFTLFLPCLVLIGDEGRKEDPEDDDIPCTSFRIHETDRHGTVRQYSTCVHIPAHVLGSSSLPWLFVQVSDFLALFLLIVLSSPCCVLWCLFASGECTWRRLCLV